MTARTYKPSPAVVTGRRIDRADAIAARARTEKRKKHDALHDFGLYTSCHCRCPDCWQPYQSAGGRCICRECPCYVLL
jgi:hypothetical protein